MYMYVYVYIYFLYTLFLKKSYRYVYKYNLLGYIVIMVLANVKNYLIVCNHNIKATHARGSFTYHRK